MYTVRCNLFQPEAGAGNSMFFFSDGAIPEGDLKCFSTELVKFHDLAGICKFLPYAWVSSRLEQQLSREELSGGDN